MLLACAGAPIRADELDDLKKAVETSAGEFTTAEKAERAALKKIEENNTQQKKAQGDELQRLKSEAIDLKSKAREATNARLAAERALASKRSELRSEASKVAEEQINAAGETNARAKRAGEAVEIWKGALQDLPAVPSVRDTSKEDDVVAAAIKKDDKAQLSDYVKWAKDEQTRVDTEIKRAENLVKNEEKFKGADGAARLLSESKSMQEKLESRRDRLKGDLKTAQERISSLGK
jgi:hypothetical protein